MCVFAGICVVRILDNSVPRTRASSSGLDRQIDRERKFVHEYLCVFVNIEYIEVYFTINTKIYEDILFVLYFKCGAPRDGTVDVDKRSALACRECCSEDYCNNRNCTRVASSSLIGR